MSTFAITLIVSFLVFWFFSLAYGAGSPISNRNIIPEPNKLLELEHEYEQSFNKVSNNLKDWEDFVFGEGGSNDD